MEILCLIRMDIWFILVRSLIHGGEVDSGLIMAMLPTDFGFMLSIAPGGGILEVSPFKLTREMVEVMGGDVNAPIYKLFSELCVKAYLACRYCFDKW